jgi:hypothetical protein
MTATLPATLFVPEFIRLERTELGQLLHVLRDPLVTHVYMLLLVHTDFKTGEFLGGYHRLIELCTPPQPERGKRRAGPSMWQLRRVIDDLVAVLLVWRNSRQNAAQAQLRLKVIPREKTSTPMQLDRREYRRVKKAENLMNTRPAEGQGGEMPQDIPQGYQGVLSQSPTPLKTVSYPQSEAAIRGRAALAALKAGIESSPPKGGKKSAPLGHVAPSEVPY